MHSFIFIRQTIPLYRPQLTFCMFSENFVTEIRAIKTSIYLFITTVKKYKIWTAIKTWCVNYEILLNIRFHKENVIKETVNFLSLTWVLLNLYFFVLWGRILTVKWAPIFVCIQNINRSQQQKYDPCRPRGPFWNSQCELEIDRPFQQTRSLNIPTKVAFKEIDCL